MKTQKEIEDLKDAIGLEVQQLQDKRDACGCEYMRKGFSYYINQKMIQYNILLEVLK